MSYNYESEAQEIKELLVGLKKFSQKGKTRISELNTYVEERQAEVQDYLHQAELTDFNAVEGFYIAKSIQNTQRTRREAKNLIELYRELEKIIQFSEIEEQSSSAVGTINQINKKINCRYYTPRIRKDLAETINKKKVKLIPKDLSDAAKMHSDLRKSLIVSK